MGLYEACQTSPVLEKDGRQFAYPDVGVRVTLARAGGANKGYVKALTKQTKDFQRAFDLGQVDNDMMEAILRPLYADEVIKLWETRVLKGTKTPCGPEEDHEWVVGIEGSDGEIRTFNRENVIETLKALPVLFERIREDSTKHAYYLQAEREANAGNS